MIAFGVYYDNSMSDTFFILTFKETNLHCAPYMYTL